LFAFSDFCRKDPEKDGMKKLQRLIENIIKYKIMPKSNKTGNKKGISGLLFVLLGLGICLIAAVIT